MFYRLQEHWNRWRFAKAAKQVWSLPPIEPVGHDTCIVSSVSHLDLSMYVVAIKSFYRQVGGGQILILDDGTLTRIDRTLLKDHVRPIEFRRLDDVPFTGGQKGVRWGIMLTIADLASESFIIQLDSDTLTRGPLPEVTASINCNQSFTLATEERFDICPISEICQMMKSRDSQHVQIVAEKNFDKLPNYEHLRYVRGNSGLAGFARDSVNRESVEQFYEDMTATIGSKWRERGSFQVSSNFFIANAPSACVLPIQRYTTVKPAAAVNCAMFLHFIGRHRFCSGLYWNETRKLLDAFSSRPDHRQGPEEARHRIGDDLL